MSIVSAYRPLTDNEVRQLKTDPGVASIQADVINQPTTNFTPTFLGLDKPTIGLWAQLGGQAHAGEDIIIGMLDSGVWPESPSFADRVDASGVPTFSTADGTVSAYGPPPAKWKGTCVVGEGVSASTCNNKLIGMRYFVAPGQVLGLFQFLVRLVKSSHRFQRARPVGVRPVESRIQFDGLAIVDQRGLVLPGVVVRVAHRGVN